MTHQTTAALTDFDTVVEALRTHERFLVVTHENPDGDALGSMLGAALGLRALGKDVADVPGGRRRRSRPSTASCRSARCCASRPPDIGDRVLLALDCANERRIAPGAGRARRMPRSSSMSTITTTTRASARSNLVVADASSTAEIVADLLAALDVPLSPQIAEALYIGVVTDTGRFQYANTTPEGPATRRRSVEAGANVHDIFRHVYETVQFAKLKLLARALEHARAFEDGRLVVSYLLRSDFAEAGADEPFSEGIIDYLRASEGSVLVALIREPPPSPAGRCIASRFAPAPTRSTCRRSPASRGAAATFRRRASRASFRSRRSSSSYAASSSRWPARRTDMPPRASSPVGVALLDKPPGPSSFALVAELRRRTRAKTGHTGTLDPFASGLLLLLSGMATRLAPCFVGLDKRYVTDVDLTSTTSTGDPEGEVLESHEPPSQAELEILLEGLRGEVELPIPAASAVKIGGERAYRLARQGIAVEMPVRRSPVYALDVITYTGDAVQLGLHVGSGTYVRSIATALGGHCTTLRRTAVGPFRDRGGRPGSAAAGVRGAVPAAVGGARPGRVRAQGAGARVRDRGCGRRRFCRRCRTSRTRSGSRSARVPAMTEPA